MFYFTPSHPVRLYQGVYVGKWANRSIYVKNWAEHVLYVEVNRSIQLRKEVG